MAARAGCRVRVRPPRQVREQAWLPQGQEPERERVAGAGGRRRRCGAWRLQRTARPEMTGAASVSPPEADARAGGIGRVEQQRVLAHELARGPVHLQDDVDERLLDHAVAGDLQVGAAIGPPLQADLGITQHRVVVDASRAVGLRRCHAGIEVGRLLGGDAGDVNLGAQGLAQGRLDVQPAQGQRPCRRSGKEQGHQCHHRAAAQDLWPGGLRNSFQGVSQIVKNTLNSAQA